MEYNLGNWLKHAWNAFTSRSPTKQRQTFGSSWSYRPDRIRLSRGNERSIVTAMYNRMALDVAQNDIKHVVTDDDGRYLETKKSGLNLCLTLEANKDQTARSFIQDVVLSMFDEGCVAIVPIDTDDNPEDGTFDVESMRRARILEWYSNDVRVEVFDDRTGLYEQLTLPKSMVAIIENPFYSVMNEPNSVLQRLVRKLVLLDQLDDRNSSGKLDLIIQLPYATRSDIKKGQAEKRRKEIEDQLVNNKYGVAYADSSEKIIQLNRPVENNLMSQIEYLTSMLYSQLGITQAIMDGSADDKAMVNYHNRTIEPILSAITVEMTRKFLSKNARTRGQIVKAFHDPFKLITVEQLADLSDKLIRGEIATPNEMRQVAGMKPSKDPKSDELRNRNLNEAKEDIIEPDNYYEYPEEEYYEEEE
ncbi:MAG: phage portal protein [Clostridiales bacterium]|nr:phage portal protein [Clostridiales bacterium]